MSGLLSDGLYVMLSNNLDATERSLKSPDIGRPTLEAIRAEFRALAAAGAREVERLARTRARIGAA